jgi:hypothetical protein
MTSAPGLRIKESLRQMGIRRPVIVGLGNEWISYMLDADEYNAGGYEPGVSFYGETLAADIVRQAVEASGEVFDSRSVVCPP